MNLKKMLPALLAGLVILGAAGWYLFPRIHYQPELTPDAIYQSLDDLAEDKKMGTLFDHLKQAQGMRLDLNHRNQAGQRSIEIAAAHDQGLAAAAFIVAGSGINEVNADGDTVTHIAVRNHSLNVIKQLAHFMPRLDIRNKAGQTPIELAAQMGDVDTVDLLTGKVTSN